MFSEDKTQREFQMCEKIRVVTRKSPLAVSQTQIVIDELLKYYPSLQFSIEKIETSGDVNLEQALPLIGGKGVFTKELESALLDGRADIAVHSLKDLPIELPKGLTIGACLSREDPSDVAVFPDLSKFFTLDELPPNSIVGTSSLRRKYTLQNQYPSLQVEDIRGNLETRLNKLNGKHNVKKEYHAIILALAGIKRSKSEFANYCVLSDEKFMHAPGQGFLAVECREGSDIMEFLKCLSDPISNKIYEAERSLLRALGGGCHTPLAVFTKFDGVFLSMKAVIYSEDGVIDASGEETVALGQSDALGSNLAKKLYDQK